MQYETEILRFKEGARSRHPSPDATVAAAQPNVLEDAGSQIAVMVDLTPQLPYRSREIRTLVVKTYWTSSGSIVARLRRALAAANRHLVDFNDKASAGNKCSGSITCAVFSEEELFLGQVGAAYAYVVHPADAETSPAGRVTFELFPKRDRLLIPLGATVPPVIHIGYTVMQPGSVACLATTRIAEARARETWKQTLALTKLNLISNRLSRDFSSRRISGSLILIRAEASPRPKPAPWVQSRAKSRVEPQRQAEAAATPTTVKPAALVPTSASQSRSSQAGAIPAEIHPKTSTGAAQGAGHPTQSAPAPETDETREDPDSEPQQTAPAAVASSPEPGQGARRKIELPRIGLSLSRAWSWARRTFVNSRAAWKWRREMRKRRAKERTTTAERARLREALRTLLPGQIEAKRKRPARTPPPERSPVMAGLAMGLLIVVVLITMTKYLQLGGPARAEELMVEAQNLQERAYDTQDPDDWYSYLDLVTQIVRLNPENAEATAMRKEAQQAVDTIENAALLSVTPLLELGTAPTPRRILVADQWVYILDTATDAVMAYPVDANYTSSQAENPTTILRRGQTYLGETVNHLVDFAWIRPGGNFPDGAVFIYSEGGAIFIYEPALGPGSITVQQLQGDLGPGNVTLMETFGEKVYLVHRQLNQILTYEPINGIYENPRFYFAEGTAPDLHLTQDIGIDGRLYLLMGDGTLQTYFAGSYDHSFELNGLPDPDLVPFVMAIEDDPDQGLVYLADTQRERIIVLNKRGDFMHQYRLPKGEFERIETLTVHERPHVLYLIANNQLHAAPLPTFGTRDTP